MSKQEKSYQDFVQAIITWDDTKQDIYKEYPNGISEYLAKNAPDVKNNAIILLADLYLRGHLDSFLSIKTAFFETNANASAESK